MSTRTNNLVGVTKAGLKAAGEVPPAPSTPAERLALWCERLPTPAPEILRTLAAQGERYNDRPTTLPLRSARSRAAATGIPGSPFCATMA